MTEDVDEKVMGILKNKRERETERERERERTPVTGFTPLRITKKKQKQNKKKRTCHSIVNCASVLA